ncbi:hypothetical protein [Lucifera butyrica]|nr:hypothetical protein [Lucifera butyrica]
MDNIMSELEKYLERARIARDDDGRLAAIMTDMEHKYSIPALSSLIPEWKRNDPNAERILKVYRYISGLRNF